MISLTPLFGAIGIEVVVIFAVIAILAATNRVSDVTESMGKAYGAYNTTRDEVESELDELEDDMEDVTSQTVGSDLEISANTDTDTSAETESDSAD